MSTSFLDNEEINDFIHEHNDFLMQYFYKHNSAFKKLIDENMHGQIENMHGQIENMHGQMTWGAGDDTEEQVKAELADNWWFSFDDVLFVVWNTRIKHVLSTTSKSFRKKYAKAHAEIFERYPVCEWWVDIHNSSSSEKYLEYIVLTNKKWFGEKVVKLAEYVRTRYEKTPLNAWIKDFKKSYDLCIDPEFNTWYEHEFKLNVSSFKAFIKQCNEHGMSTDDDIRQNVFNSLRQVVASSLWYDRSKIDAISMIGCKMIDIA